MRNKRSWIRTMVCLIVMVGLAGSAFAGIGGCRDRKGRYLGTRWTIDPVKPYGTIWSDFNADSQSFAALNPDGDANGDLWPAVVEDTLDPHHPWVVWSHFNGRDYDLAWARWRGLRWTPIRKVHRDAALGNDLDPDLAFDAKGRSYVVWWRSERGVGRIYMSVFLNSDWMAEIQISDVSMDSRHPTIQILEDGKILVEYETPRGLYAQSVRFREPVTITDDINPFAHLELVGGAVMVRRND